MSWYQAYLLIHFVKEVSNSVASPPPWMSIHINLLFSCITDEYWSMHPELHDIPIYYASSLAKKCMAVYQTYINAMNSKIQKQIAVSNPFDFKHISYLKVSHVHEHIQNVFIEAIHCMDGRNGLNCKPKL